MTSLRKLWLLLLMMSMCGVIPLHAQQAGIVRTCFAKVLDIPVYCITFFTSYFSSNLTFHAVRTKYAYVDGCLPIAPFMSTQKNMLENTTIMQHYLRSADDADRVFEHVFADNICNVTTYVGYTSVETRYSKISGELCALLARNNRSLLEQIAQNILSKREGVSIADKQLCEDYLQRISNNTSDVQSFFNLIIKSMVMNKIGLAYEVYHHLIDTWLNAGASFALLPREYACALVKYFLDDSQRENVLCNKEWQKFFTNHHYGYNQLLDYVFNEGFSNLTIKNVGQAYSFFSHYILYAVSADSLQNDDAVSALTQCLVAKLKQLKLGQSEIYNLDKTFLLHENFKGVQGLIALEHSEEQSKRAGSIKRSLSDFNCDKNFKAAEECSNNELREQILKLQPILCRAFVTHQLSNNEEFCEQFLRSIEWPFFDTYYMHDFANIQLMCSAKKADKFASKILKKHLRDFKSKTDPAILTFLMSKGARVSDIPLEYFLEFPDLLENAPLESPDNKKKLKDLYDLVSYWLTDYNLFYKKCIELNDYKYDTYITVLEANPIHAFLVAKNYIRHFKEHVSEVHVINLLKEAPTEFDQLEIVASVLKNNIMSAQALLNCLLEMSKDNVLKEGNLVTFIKMCLDANIGADPNTIQSYLAPLFSHNKFHAIISLLARYKLSQATADSIIDYVRLDSSRLSKQFNLLVISAIVSQCSAKSVRTILKQLNYLGRTNHSVLDNSGLETLVANCVRINPDEDWHDAEYLAKQIDAVLSIKSYFFKTIDTFLLVKSLNMDGSYAYSSESVRHLFLKFWLVNSAAQPLSLRAAEKVLECLIVRDCDSDLNATKELYQSDVVTNFNEIIKKFREWSASLKKPVQVPEFEHATVEAWCNSHFRAVYALNSNKSLPLLQYIFSQAKEYKKLIMPTVPSLYLKSMECLDINIRVLCETLQKDATYKGSPQISTEAIDEAILKGVAQCGRCHERFGDVWVNGKAGSYQHLACYDPLCQTCYEQCKGQLCQAPREHDEKCQQLITLRID